MRRAAPNSYYDGAPSRRKGRATLRSTLEAEEVTAGSDKKHQQNNV